MASFIAMTAEGNRCCGCTSRRLSCSVSGCFLTAAAAQLNPVRLVSVATAVTMATVLSSLRPFSYCTSASRAAPMNLIQSPRVVTTQYGKLRGLIVYRPSSGDTASAGFDATTGTKQVPVEQFLGLQYASTLGSELRFMPPTGSMEKWEGVRIALKHRPVCPQPIPDLVALARRLPRGRIEHFKRLAAFVDKQTEDCLSLNIYVPFYDSNATRVLFPVVVFIHGESYDVGTGNAYDGSVMAAYGQLVVVTLNYRLGVLGFLSTGDSNAPGNYAILDLVAALHWIKANILQFGGDPSSVTLMGHSHGASLVNLLLVSPVTRDSGLFRRAIILSGTALASWSVTSEPVRQAIQLTRAVNCTSSAEHQISSSAALPSAVRRLSKGQSAVPLSHSHQTVDDAITLSPASLRCLKRLPVDRLVNAAGPTSLEAGPRYLAPFGPTIDGRSVLPAEVNRLTGDMARGTMFGGVDLLVGFMKNEGYVYLNQTDIDEGISSDRLHRAIRTFVRNVYSYHRQYINDILLYQYQQDLGNSVPTSGAGPAQTADPASVRNLLMELIGDALQVAPSIDLARRHVATITGTSGSAIARNHFSDLAADDDDDDDDDWGDDVKQPLSQQTSTVGTTSTTTTKSRPDVRLEQATSNESAGGPGTYVYCFAYPTRFDVYPRWADGVHGDDLAYIFGAPLAAMGGLAVGVAMPATAPTVEPFPSVFTRADRLLSETVMRYWISFIRTGNPNSFIGPSSFKGDDSAGSLDSAIPYWPRFEMTNEHYLHIGVKPTVRQHFRADKMAFWLDLIPRIHRPDTNTAGSSSKFHQLDDPKNASSFEPDGTLEVEYDDDIFSSKNSENDDVILTSTAHTSAPALPGIESVSLTSFPHKVDSSVHSINLTTTLLLIGQSMSTVTDGNLATSDFASGIPIEPEVLHRDIDDMTNGNEGTSLPTGKMALFGTGMIGCVVLIVNCAVFAAIFKRRSRMRKRDNTSAAQLVPRSDTDAAATGSGRPSLSSTMNSTARRHHSATGSSQTGYRVHFAGDALSTSSSTVNGHGSSNGRVCSRLSAEEMADDVRSPSSMNCTSFISDRHPVANGNGLSTMCNYSSFPPPPPPNFLASHASTTRRPLQDNDSLKDGSSIAPSTLPGTTSASITALPPPSSTLRRTPYSPRYASDGRLKHFPVAGTISTKADSAVVKAVAASSGSTSHFGSVFGNTASLHYHPRCRHHHVLPNSCCDSPTISTKPMTQTDQ